MVHLACYDGAASSACLLKAHLAIERKKCQLSVSDIFILAFVGLSSRMLLEYEVIWGGHVDILVVAG